MVENQENEIIPFVDLYLQNRLILNSVNNDINQIFCKSIFLSGDFLKNFEDEYQKFTKSKYVIGVANGTDALEISLRALNLSSTAIVCVPAFTFAATGLAVLRCGLNLIFCDVNSKTGSIDVDILNGLKVIPDVLIYVSLFGRGIDPEVVKWASKNKVTLIEDGAQSQGSVNYSLDEFQDIKFISTSFYPTKNLGCAGDGGAILIQDEKYLDNILRLRNYGGLKKYEHKTFGFNSRLSEIQSAILIRKLKFLKEWNLERIELAKEYTVLLREVSEIELPEFEFNGTHVFHLYPIKVKARDEVRSKLNKQGIATGIHYPSALPELDVFQFASRDNDNFKNSTEWAKANLTLPIYPGLSIKKVKHVVDALKKVLL